MDRYFLKEWPRQARFFTALFLIILSIGVSVGLVYLNFETGLSMEGTLEHYKGTELAEDFDIPEKYPKPVSGMLLTTHTHIIAFSQIFFILGGLTFFSSKISRQWKIFLMTEPLVATITTFGSIWGLRYLHPAFGVLTMVSGILMYLSFYGIVFMLLMELINPKR